MLQTTTRSLQALLAMIPRMWAWGTRIPKQLDSWAREPFNMQRLGLTTLVVLCLAFMIVESVLSARYEASPFIDRVPWWSFSTAMKEWQTLLTGVLAVATAAFAGAIVMRQIRQTQDLEDQRCARRYRAARAMMPEAMSRICAYSNDSYLALKSQWFIATTVEIDASNNPVPSAPVLNTEMFEDIKLVIENLASDRSAAAYIQLLSDLQVHQTRWSGRLQEIADPMSVVPTVEFEHEMVEAAELYALASSLIGASRPTPSPEDLAPMTRARSVRFLDLDPPIRVRERAQRLDLSNPLPAP